MDREKIANLFRCLRNCRIYPSLCRKPPSRCKIFIDDEDYIWADQTLSLFDPKAINREICANCDTPLLREGKHLEAIRREERERQLNWFLELIEDFGYVSIRKYEIRKIVGQALRGDKEE